MGDRGTRRAVDAVADAVVDPRSDAAVTALAAYFAELDQRFVGGFDVDKALADDPASMRPPTGSFVVGLAGVEPVACGAIVRCDHWFEKPLTGDDSAVPRRPD